MSAVGRPVDVEKQKSEEKKTKITSSVDLSSLETILGSSYIERVGILNLTVGLARGGTKAKAAQCQCPVTLYQQSHLLSQSHRKFAHANWVLHLSLLVYRQSGEEITCSLSNWFYLPLQI